MKRNVAAQVASVLVLFFLAWKANGKGYNYPSRCGDGDVITIKYPFRLKGDPPKRGDPRYELTCDANRTILVLDSKIYHVKAISYQNKTIRIVEPGLSHGDWSLPRYHLLNPLHWAEVTNNSYFRIGRRILAVLKCQDSVDDSSYVDATPCINVSDSFSSQGYTYVLVKDGRSNPDMRDSCNLIAMVQTKLQEIDNRSIVDIHMELMMGFEISWEPSSCLDCDEKVSTCTDPCSFGDARGRSAAPLFICFFVGSFVILALIVTTVKVYGRWKTNLKTEKENQLKIEKFLKEYKSLQPVRYSYADIKRMINQVKRKLGQGGYGSVFKGKLRNGTFVAVKVLEKYKGNGEDFINEVSTIGKIHHINVVSLLGFCAEGSKRALVYEFMPNKSLDKFIFSVVRNTSVLLGWEKLCNIAIGIATGIDYLHQGCDQRILHFDIKPHNILLDENFNPKISDFGLAKLCSKGQSVVSMTAARGTIGYIAPEVCSRNLGDVSHKSDVYSFGMLLLEMVGGRKNIDSTVENVSQVYFPEWIYNHLIKGEEIGIRTVVEGDAEMAKKLAVVALWCIQWYPVDRPSMKNVVQMLEGDSGSLNIPPNPFASNALPPLPNTVAASPEEPHQVVLTVISEIE